MAGANIVRDYSIGNTRIKFADNYCSRNADDVSWILKQIAAQAQRHINAAATAGNYGQEQGQIHTADCR